MSDLTKVIESALEDALREARTGEVLIEPEQIARLLEPTVKADLRRKYGGRFLWLIVGLDVVVIGLVVLTGRGWLALDRQVLMALIGATVVQTGGIAYLIAKFLFPQS